MIKRILTISLIVLGSLFTTESYCQMYDSAAGLRGGTGATVSYKKFLGRAIAFEGILGSFDYDFFGASILIQKYT
ncbi:MAG: hypothetical protein HKN76_05025, partial [Saprospiraceae bacterium]|nr:hypothetical protein [Saprospiraceae bacterium]